VRTPEMAGMCGVELFGVCNGMWPDGTAPMGPMDASDGMPTVACATCGQNRNPASLASVDLDMPIEPQRQAIERRAEREERRMKSINEMTFNELVEWSCGHLLLEIGAGNFRYAVWLIVQQAWSSGYELAKRKERHEG